ncbi:MAG: hypothetical protein L7U72_14870 [Rubripirellula sp.]|nr:hypothetical protein [Rubripirellula sp.]
MSSLGKLRQTSDAHSTADATVLQNDRYQHSRQARFDGSSPTVLSRLNLGDAGTRNAEQVPPLTRIFRIRARPGSTEPAAFDPASSSVWRSILGLESDSTAGVGSPAFDATY